MSCALCPLDATATYRGLDLCDQCAATAELGHLRKTGTLRAVFSEDTKWFETNRGVRLLPVLRFWRWEQAVRRHGWATMWHVAVADPETGKQYFGRCAGPGKPLTLREKLLTKREREKLGEA